MKRVFLSLPSLDGHRQIYCRELCDYFLHRGFSVTVATDLAGLQEYTQLAILRGDPRIQFIADPWAGESDPTKQLRKLSAATEKVGADLIFLAEADDARGLLSAQIARPKQRLPGRRVGLFIRSGNYVHELDFPRTGRIPRALVRAYTYRPLSLTQPRIFHEIVMRKFSVLDAALCLDEVFVSRQRGECGWLPDIAVASSDLHQASPESATWCTRVSNFITAHPDRPVVVYVGTPQARRGFEVLLQLACDVDGCFLHCGKPRESSPDPDMDLGARSMLYSRDAILELGRFYQDFETAQVTLAAARCVVLPYAGHLGSSGVMLQALMAGRSVLVPDQGLMASRVRDFGLGLTFEPDNWREMRRMFLILQSTPPAFFATPIRRFLRYFTKPQFEAAMDVAAGLSQTGPVVPPVTDSDRI